MMRVQDDVKFAALPRVVVVSLASCFGCQLQITNAESHLIDVLGQIDLQYWQLTSSGAMPESFDIAIVEGAVTTDEAVSTLQSIRETASLVVAIGACATLGGVPGLACSDFKSRASVVYPDALPSACGSIIEPRPVHDVIDVDVEIRCCPVDSYGVIDALHRAIYGSNYTTSTKTLCGECKLGERGCFYEAGTLCLGLVTTSGCGARCVSRGRPCSGCAGISPDANLVSAREVCIRYGVSPDQLNEKLDVFNAARAISSTAE